MNWLKQNRVKIGLGAALAVLPALFFLLDEKCNSNWDCGKKASIVDVFPKDTPKINLLGREVTWVGEVIALMTYGRLELKKLVPDDFYPEFIAEPVDVVEDGALRYSPTTRNFKHGQILKVTGYLLEGEVPWIEIENIEPYNNKISNRFGSLRWRTEKIEEYNLHARINLEYPQFVGSPAIQGLNSHIKNLVLSRVQKNKKEVAGWIEDKNGRFWKETCGRDDPIISDDGHKLLWECSVVLKSEFRIVSIINDIVSIEFIFTDHTGGGNGNHQDPIAINYDLKSDRPINPKDLFCGGDYPYLLPISAYKELYKGILEISYGEDNKDVVSSIEETYRKLGNSHELWKSELKDMGVENLDNILLDKDGIIVLFRPYQVASGAVGVFGIKIPYQYLKGVVCLP